MVILDGAQQSGNGTSYASLVKMRLGVVNLHWHQIFFCVWLPFTLPCFFLFILHSKATSFFGSRQTNIAMKKGKEQFQLHLYGSQWRCVRAWRQS